MMNVIKNILKNNLINNDINIMNNILDFLEPRKYNIEIKIHDCFFENEKWKNYNVNEVKKLKLNVDFQKSICNYCHKYNNHFNLFINLEDEDQDIIDLHRDENVILEDYNFVYKYKYMCDDCFGFNNNTKIMKWN